MARQRPPQLNPRSTVDRGGSEERRRMVRERREEGRRLRELEKRLRGKEV